MKFKFHWKVIVVALPVLVGTIFWSVDSLRTRWYSGADLNFGVGGGPVTVTNPSGIALPVQLVSTRPGTFTVSSSIEGVSGRSTTQGSGRNATQLFEFVLLPGVNEFSVLRGVDVNFVSSASTPSEATVQPLNAADTQTTFVVAEIAILGSLFFLLPGLTAISLDQRATPPKSQWIKLLLRKPRERFSSASMDGRAGSGK